jgi:hypothetical protein
MPAYPRGTSLEAATSDGALTTAVMVGGVTLCQRIPSI